MLGYGIEPGIELEGFGIAREHGLCPGALVGALCEDAVRAQRVLVFRTAG